MFSIACCPPQAIIYPLELIKTRLAVSPAGSYTGIAHCAGQVLRHEGWRSFYRGMLPSMVRAQVLGISTVQMDVAVVIASLQYSLDRSCCALVCGTKQCVGSPMSGRVLSLCCQQVQRLLHHESPLQ
jgi:Mitochondrial carrier protein